MRMLSLLITLMIVAWLVYTQLGGNKAPTEAASYRQAEQKAQQAVDQVEAQTAAQAASLARIQDQASQAVQSVEQHSADSAP